MAKNFKVIVVGGGPVGLSAAHALYLAGIDFVVLEGRPSVFENLGAAVILSAQSLRVMHQFGLLDSLRAISSELAVHRSFESSGYNFANTSQFTLMKESHGIGQTCIHRAEFLETMYYGLPQGSRDNILTGKKVVDITSDDAGVSVTCSDGSSYTGSIIIGADGVHSRTRRAMRELALAEDSERVWDPENPFVAEYSVAWCTVPTMPIANILIDTQSHGRSGMYIAGKDKGWLFMHGRLPKKTSEWARYTKEDVKRHAAQFADFTLTEGCRYGDVFSLENAGMTNLEEGIVKNWSWRRVVLVGDACHKVVPNTAMGYQDGLQDVVVLCNLLRRAVRSAPERGPDSRTLEGVFDEYKEMRRVPLKQTADEAAVAIRMHTWRNWIYYVFARYVISWDFVMRLFVRVMDAPRVARTRVLDYVPASVPFTGTVEWVHSIPKPSNLEEGSGMP